MIVLDEEKLRLVNFSGRRSAVIFKRCLRERAEVPESGLAWKASEEGSVRHRRPTNQRFYTSTRRAK